MEFFANPKITYIAKWDIHPNRDFVRIQAFVDNVMGELARRSYYCWF